MAKFAMFDIQSWAKLTMVTGPLNIRWLPAGLRDRVHADAWQMQIYARTEHIMVQAEQQ